MGPLESGDPQRVGSYRLVGRLGEGGMGQVFLGESPSGRKVAVKLLHERFARDQGFRTRFAREVKAARKVSGFYTAAVVDADADAMPPWMVTAYVPGPTLGAAIRADGPKSAGQVRALGAMLAEGLAAIHSCGLVHRDFKPGNIILAEDGPRILDFGVARALDANTTITSTGTTLGTIRYMSPEQVNGAKVSPASDVFSFGSVLTYAATGHGPFDAPLETAMMWRIAEREPDLHGLPKSLRDVVASCLTKQPADRPALSEVLAQLGTAPFAQAKASQPKAPPARAPQAKAPQAQPPQVRPPQVREPPAQAPRTAETRLTVPTGPTGPAQGGPIQGLPGQGLPTPSAPLHGRLEQASGGLLERAAARVREMAVERMLRADGGSQPGYRGDPGAASVPTPSMVLDGMAGSGTPSAVAFSRDGRLLAVAGRARSGVEAQVRFWEIPGRRGDHLPVTGSKVLMHPYAALAFSPNGRFLACQGGLSVPQFWDLSSRQPARLSGGGHGAVRRLAFSPDGRLIAVVHEDRTLRLWDATTGRLLGVPLLESTRDCHPVFSPDGRVLAFPASTGKLSFWDVTDARSPAPVLIPSPLDSTPMAFSPDSSLVAIAKQGPGPKARPIIYSLAAAGPVGGQLAGAEFPASALWFSPDGTFLAAGAAGARAEVPFAFWNVTEPRPAARLLDGLSGVVKKAVFSPDSRLLAVVTAAPGAKASNGQSQQVVQVWDTAADRPAMPPVSCLTGRAVTTMEFSRDGRFLLTGTADRSVLCWDFATLRHTPLPVELTGTDPLVAFSPDGSALVTAAQGIVRLWDLPAR